MYLYIYNNWRVADLPWDSALTWYLALLGVDFCYYWVHRASHGTSRAKDLTFGFRRAHGGEDDVRLPMEPDVRPAQPDGSESENYVENSENVCFSVAEVHILWAQHQVHHSSEDYNLAVGLRQSVLQGWCGFVSVSPPRLAPPRPARDVAESLDLSESSCPIPRRSSTCPWRCSSRRHTS